MLPILFTIGSLHIYSIGVSFVVAWMLFSFLFWRALRNLAIDEEKIYALMFTSTVTVFMSSRIAYVATHWSFFSGSWLRIFTIWLTPGLSFIGGLVALVVTTVYVSRSYQLRIGPILDSLVKALGVAFIIGSFGMLLDGSVVGKPSNFIWSIPYNGSILRHPVQLYEMLGVAFILAILLLVKKWFRGYFSTHAGMIGIWYFFLSSILFFCVELVKEGSVYWGSLSISQWVYVAIACESIGMLFVRGEGTYIVRRIYAGISGRFIRKPTGTS